LWAELGIEELSPRAAQLATWAAPLFAPSEAPATPDVTRGLDAIRTSLGDGCGTRLCSDRNKLVFGAGNPHAPLFFLGESPGADDDRSGLPFQGPDGGLLTKIIEAMGYRRDGVYLTHVVKCRTPQDRAPAPEEARLCSATLRAQVAAVNPRVIVALGAAAATALLDSPGPLAGIRGKLVPLAWDANVWVMPTYAPAQLVRQPELKRLVWEDMKKVKAHLEGAA
jgi:DNA polymerase